VRLRAGWLSLMIAALLAGCGGGTTPAPTPAPTTSAAPARTVVPVPSSVQEIPGQPPVVHYGTVDSPEVGVAYEYHLYIHCVSGPLCSGGVGGWPSSHGR